LGIFSIKDIEAVSGIKCHTLRIWEQRYNILTPKRTDTNIRFYDDDDLKLILNISILNKHGHKISEISKMSRDQMNENVIKISGNTNEHNCQIKSLISSMMVFDEFEFHKTLTTSIIQIGLEETMMKVVFPFMLEVGILWQTGSIYPSHEHFASNIIKQKLYVAVDGNVGRYTQYRKRFLLFLPEREQHSLGLMFANFIIRSRGHEVLYLGQEIPLNDLKTTFAGHLPDYIFTILTAAHLDIEKQEFVNELSAYWKDSKILLSGSQFLMADIHYPQNVTLIKRMEEFIQLVNNLSEIATVN
jgi:DNA-binding transcriptional MerR regulator